MNKKGFTYVELLVVVSIISIIVGSLVVSLNGQRSGARNSKRIAEMDAMRISLEFHYLDYGSYPESEGGSWICVEESGNFSSGMEKYFSSLPVDPLYPAEYEPGKKYCYSYVSTDNNHTYRAHVRLENGSDYTVYSKGSQIIPGP